MRRIAAVLLVLAALAAAYAAAFAVWMTAYHAEEPVVAAWRGRAAVYGIACLASVVATLAVLRRPKRGDWKDAPPAK